MSGLKEYSGLILYLMAPRVVKEGVQEFYAKFM